ncbi:enoyl-CoA hydratase-related protein [Achromobacter sp. SIMBA_011]|jgi:enoyl-CoA hydratase|uniref:enoyl-CoA hydratase/isomerase family protein n=1 Tax=Achromobacter TaxID=222 RepID=UPI0001F43B23|nr:MULTISPECIES: enoyl-CoA hydratase-related protein [Achromobacter]EFV86230.1 enoyl-CoA hydratase/isomerase [Achromobacter xylosoxidans C54]MCZ8409180.1 enoyl-CoA hydratase-related protein [Achromobacter dolens]
MTVVTELHDQVAVIKLNRPQALNALNEQMLADLGAALDEAQASSCRAMVFIGAEDKALCAGADIAQLQARTAATHRANIGQAQTLFNRIQQSSLPSVAVIHGFAFGGGLELALACTFRIATAKARMALPEVKLGLIPGYGGTQRLPRLIGEARAAELVLSGRTVDAEEALVIGLVNRIVEGDDPGDLGRAFLAPMLRHSKVAITMAREAMRRGLDGALASGLAIEADMFALCVQSSDAAEGIAAFLGKRPAAFTDN